MKQKTARIGLIVLIIAMLLGSMLGCKIDGDGNKTPTAGCYIGADGVVHCPPPEWERLEATATYGAEQFWQQLTAVAEPEE